MAAPSDGESYIHGHRRGDLTSLVRIMVLNRHVMEDMKVDLCIAVRCCVGCFTGPSQQPARQRATALHWATTCTVDAHDTMAYFLRHLPYRGRHAARGLTASPTRCAASSR
jgi:hypothetical protein